MTRPIYRDHEWTCVEIDGNWDHFVYAIYDRSGVIHYVGCSVRPEMRFTQHMQWVGRVRGTRADKPARSRFRLAIVYAGTGPEAFAMERLLIRTLHARGAPLANKIGTGWRPAKRRRPYVSLMRRTA